MTARRRRRDCEIGRYVHLASALYECDVDGRADSHVEFAELGSIRVLHTLEPVKIRAQPGTVYDQRFMLNLNFSVLYVWHFPVPRVW